MNSSISLANDTLSSTLLELCYILRPMGYYFIFIWITGTILNGSVLYILIRNKKLRQSSTNILIGGLLLADFIGACFELPLPAFSLIYCRLEYSYSTEKNNVIRIFIDGSFLILVVYMKL